MWLTTCDLLRRLKTKCDINKATIGDLKVIICILYIHFNEANDMTDYDREMCWTSL